MVSVTTYNLKALEIYTSFWTAFKGLLRSVDNNLYPFYFPFISFSVSTQQATKEEQFMDTPQLNDNDNKDTDLAAGVAT